MVVLNVIDREEPNATKTKMKSKRQDGSDAYSDQVEAQNDESIMIQAECHDRTMMLYTKILVVGGNKMWISGLMHGQMKALFFQVDLLGSCVQMASRSHSFSFSQGNGRGK